MCSRCTAPLTLCRCPEGKQRVIDCVACETHGIASAYLHEQE
jgi:hypothetical protein